MPWTTRRPPRRHGAPGRDTTRTRRDRARHPRRTHAAAAVRARRTAVSGRSATVGGQYPPGVELRARPQRLHRRRDRGDHRPDRAVRPRLPGTRHRSNSSLDAQIGRLQPQLRRRRHHDRRQGHPPADIRPRITLSPYTVRVPGMYICSAATPPGPGAHGMCGANAARVALARLAQWRRHPAARVPAERRRACRLLAKLSALGG